VSHGEPDDPRCPECGEPIGATATYCMHCSADLTEERERADADGDGFWDESTDAEAATEEASSTDRERLLDPDGFVDNTLTAAVGLAGGLVVGVVGTVVLMALSGGWAAWLGILAWLVATGYLVSRRTVQEALARTAYGVAIVLLLVPLIAFGPSDGDTDLVARIVVFAAMLGTLVIPAAIAAGIGFVISRFVPGAGGEE